MDTTIEEESLEEESLEKKRRTNRMLLVGLIVLALVLLGVSIAGVVSYSKAHASCSIGVSGFAMTVTVEGNGADEFCSNPAIGNSAMFYHYEGTPSGAEVCVGDHKRSDGSTLHYVVRDSAAFTLLDMAVCNRLRSP